MPESREELLLKQLQTVRDDFRTKYERAMTEEERRILDFAEQLVKSNAGAKAVGE